MVRVSSVNALEELQLVNCGNQVFDETQDMHGLGTHNQCLDMCFERGYLVSASSFAYESYEAVLFSAW